ncbi:ATP-dependent DNA ligase [Acidisarcina polymorpha]|uniref:DNA ligase (ATP) n=1 Tax=Acidisarcina polymorpha TaxID=2211140 RepID=A0A2Z5FWQ1_9BACT|nr:DNA ligase D [Acidisarcina polymorpha]AXC11140.1 ATP-dependent DNA ligase [Acidisarcina polymorpha]
MATRRKGAAKPSTQATPADAIDAQLERYRSMRDFDVTAEPSGGKKTEAAPQGLPFVIQKHAATRLHYDFRLGWNGVLKSWACAKGPSYVTADKRLAVQVEDHPMEYGGFEGIIPKGQYGGGTVMLWDEGTWEPQPGHTDVDEGLRTGSLKFIMHGTKMKGKWTLIRMGGKAASESKPNWLLIKEHDDFERKPDDPAITEEAPNSVVTGRSLEEIARNEDHVWNSKETATGNAWHRNDQQSKSEKPVTTAGAASKKSAVRAGAASNNAASNNFEAELKKTPKEKLPDFIRPQLASQATKPPADKGWIHELKLDGYRIQARKDGERVQLLTRTGLDWTHRMKTIAAEVAKLPADNFLADGEVVVLADDGTTSFADLQAAFQEGIRKPLTYFVFDLLHLNGHNLRGLPLLERKAMLAKLLHESGEFVRLGEHLETDGATMFRKACEFGAEGIVSKRADSPYSSSRSSSWLKLKCIRGQEFVIGGFTLPSNGIHGVGALLLGYYQDKKLIYAGRTGTGFTQKTHAKLRDQLDKLRQSSTAFEKPPAEARKGAIWVRPELVAQVNFSTWTADNLVRQASFQGLREDKPASEVVREAAGTSPKPRIPKHADPAPSAEKAVPSLASRNNTGEGKTQHAPIRLTHPDKILDAASQLTKQQLADYYWQIAPFMLPHIAGRPLSLVRCPEGSGQPCFFQKHASNMLPKSLESVEVRDKKTGKIEPYITLSTQTALAELAQLGVLELHPWGSRNEDLEHPDRIIIDLDPDTAIEWQTLAASAAEVRAALKKLHLESFLKTTGGKGLHVVIPIEPEYDWGVVKQFAHAFALSMEKQNPALYLTKMTKSARAGRIYIDYLRNERGATAVAPFSPRARPEANVSMPINWSELKLPERPTFRVVDFAEWSSRLKRDPWKRLPATNQRITPEVLSSFKISA